MKGRQLLSPRHLVRRFSPVLASACDLGLQRGLQRAEDMGWGTWRGLRSPATLGRLGELEVRLAVSAAEVRRAQALRYRVFYEEMSATGDPRTDLMRRDADRFDAVCDHLLVLDHANRSRPLLRQQPEIVGTYRMLRQDVAARTGGFYTDDEYDVAPLLRSKPDLRFLELGRSCVLKPYRTKRTIELLWQGIWAYVLTHRIDVMIGCASLEGTDPERLKLPLSFLHHLCAAPPEWTVRARAPRRVEMDRMPLAAIEPKAAMRTLPPLIKGYLRLGAHIGDGAVVDTQFGTTDVCIVLPVAAISSRYTDYYGQEAGSRAA